MSAKGEDNFHVESLFESVLTDEINIHVNPGSCLDG